jgi:predicted PurR-regulated permease PerM
MQIRQLTYWGSKQYEVITIISLILVSSIVGFILTMLIINETDKLSRTNFLQNVTQRIRNETNKLSRTIGNETNKLSNAFGNETNKLSKTIGNETNKLTGINGLTQRIGLKF